MSDSLISGAQALCDWVTAALKAHWQATLTAICTDLGISPALTAPDATHGYSPSRLLPRNTSPSCCVFVDGTVYDEQRLIILGAPRRMITTVRVRLRWAPMVAVEAERQAQAYTAAARQVIMQRWRSAHSAGADKIRCVDLTIATDESGSSIRQRGQAEGLTDYGRGYEATDETVDIVVRADHFVAHPVTL
jgi:hypothetical protein